MNFSINFATCQSLVPVMQDVFVLRRSIYCDSGYEQLEETRDVET